MDQVHVIRHQVLVEGRSSRSVARELGVSRNTVKKYVSESEPQREESGPRARPVLERVVARLDELLGLWRTTRKQRVTGARLHRQLREEGHAVGVTTVRGYLREWRRQREEVSVRAATVAGGRGIEKGHGPGAGRDLFGAELLPIAQNRRNLDGCRA